jgi:putative ABC transport system permease protein
MRVAEPFPLILPLTFQHDRDRRDLPPQVTMTTLLQDIRFAVRGFRKSPGFTAVAVLTLALGIGANTAIFSVVHGVLLAPLPFREPDRLVSVAHWYPQINLRAGVSAPGISYYREHAQAFESLSAFTGWNANLTVDGVPERVLGQLVQADYFRTLGVPVLAGWPFGPDEEVASGRQTLIISDGLWTRAFARDPAILERTLVINGEAYQVVGVVAGGLDQTNPVEMWAPLVFEPQQLSPNFWGNEYMGTVGRLREGITLEAGQADLDRLAEQVRNLDGNPRNENWGLILTPLREQLFGNIRPALLVLMGAVAFVLLIACANLANLLLVRASARQRELAVRTALGAGRGRLVRQLLTECLVLSVIGGAAGLLVAQLAVGGFTAINPGNLPRAASIGLNGTVLLFALLVSLGIGVLFGLAPAWQVSRPAVFGMLKDGLRGTGAGMGRGSLRATLVVSEIALSLVLLIGAGLMIKTFGNLTEVDVGFQAEGVMTAAISLPAARYPDSTSRAVFIDRVLEGVRSLPGVELAASVTGLPMTGQNSTRSFQVEGHETPEGQSGPWGDFRIASAGYFEAMRIPLRQGRSFTPADRAGAPLVVIVDEVLAERYWPGEAAIGKRIGWGGGPDGTVWREVVGVVSHVVMTGAREDLHTQMYIPVAQQPPAGMMLVARAQGNPAALAEPIRRVVTGLDPDQPVFDTQSMSTRLAGSTAQSRFTMLLLGLFGAIALALAGIGIYGVMSYSVAQQTRELGIRLALGAETGSVLRLVLNRGLVLAVTGILAGLALAFWLGRLIQSQLYEVSPRDPAVFVLVAVVLGVVAVLSSYLPARRATRVDPIVALRAE